MIIFPFNKINTEDMIVDTKNCIEETDDNTNNTHNNVKNPKKPKKTKKKSYKSIMKDLIKSKDSKEKINTNYTNKLMKSLGNGSFKKIDFI